MHARPKLSPEVVEALSRLRVHARLHSNPMSLREAIDVLDNADVFAVVDEYRDELEAEPRTRET